MPVIDGWIGTIDVAVVGAGSAGVAAARRIQALRPDLSVLVLEAGRRIGGRACTIVPSALGVPVDVGCGWLHGARTNAWTQIAGELGLAVDRTPAPWDGGGRELGLPPEDRADCDAAMERFFTRAETWVDTEPDAPLSTLLEPGNRWNALIGAIGTYINGAELDRASIRDYQNYDPGPGPDWRLRDGYGGLIETYGVPVPVAFDAAVSRVEHGGATGVRLETSRGTLLARAVVVTVSTDVLAAEAVRFDPPLPGKVEAASNLPLGLADKMFLSLAEPENFPANSHLLGSAHRIGTAAYHIRPFGRPVIECYFAGQRAHDLEREGEAAALAFAADELAGHFGNDIRGRLGFGAISAWARDPLFRGSYSYAKPGFAAARAVLAAPVDGRVFFAGEACPPHRFSTAHGAYESGVAAADEVMAQLPRI